MASDANLYESNLKNWVTLVFSQDLYWPTETELRAALSKMAANRRNNYITPLRGSLSHVAHAKLLQLFDYFANLQYTCNLSYSRLFKSMCERLCRFYRMCFFSHVCFEPWFYMSSSPILACFFLNCMMHAFFECFCAFEQDSGFEQDLSSLQY